MNQILKYCLCYILAVLCSTAQSRAQSGAQDPVGMVGAYANENAIFTYRHEDLELSYEKGKLVATRYVEEEQLLTSDAAASLYNTDFVYSSEFGKLENLEAEALIPQPDGTYRHVPATDFKTTHSESESIFYDDAKQTRITYAGLVKGARKHIKYAIRHDDIRFLHGFHFQSYLRVLDARLTITAPKDVEIRHILYGLHQDVVHKDVEEKRKDRIYTFSARNIPRLQTYDDAPTASYYMTQLLYYIGSYTGDNGAPVKVFGNVTDLYRFYYPFIRDVNTTPDPTLSALAADLTKSAKSARDKARSIYEWTQQNMKYVAFEDGMGGFVPRQAAQVCSRRFGDCKDMTSVQVGLCRLAGVDAYFAWTGTRHLPYDYATVPLPATDNHMICVAKLDGEWVFMDGTDATTPFGTPPYYLQGKEVLIGIDSTHYEVVKVPEMPVSSSLATDTTRIRLEDGMIKGSTVMRFAGYPAWRLQSSLKYYNATEQDEKLKDLLSRGSNKYLLSDAAYAVEAPGAARNLVVRGNFTLADYARKVGGEWYVNMNLLKTYGSYIDTAGREVGAEFSYSQRVKEITVLDIPKGFHLSYKPDDVQGGVPGMFTYSIRYTASGRQIVEEKTIEIGTLYVPVGKLPEYNRIAGALALQYKEAIVLAAD